MSQKAYIVGKIYVINSAFNPDEQDPILTYIEYHFFLSFTKNIGKEYLIEVATYEIITDISMTPVINEETITGAYINRYESHNFERLSEQTYYASAYF